MGKECRAESTNLKYFKGCVLEILRYKELIKAAHFCGEEFKLASSKISISKELTMFP